MKRKGQKKVDKGDFSIFKACAEIEKIPYWKEFFTACSYGNFPPGISYTDNMLHYRKNKKNSPIVIYIPYDTKEALTVIKDFMRKEIGLLSTDEVRKKKIMMNKTLKNNIIKDELEWKSIRSRLTKERLIAIFVRKVQTKLNLSNEDARQLKTVITFGIISGDITTEDIIIENAEIVNIKGIQRNDNGFFIAKPEIIPEKTYVKMVEKHHQIKIDREWKKIVNQHNTIKG